MADENVSAGTQNVTSVVPPVQAPPPPQAPGNLPAQSSTGTASAQATEPLPAGMAPTGDGKGIQVLSTAAYKRLKDESRERGRREAVAELTSALGFDNVDAMKAALAKAKNAPESQAQPDRGKEPQAGESKSHRAVVRERDRLREELDQLKQQMAKEVTTKKKMRDQLDQLEAEMVLREAAVRAGVRDVKYALHLVQESLKGKPEEELASFDEAKFFEGLRSSHPYIFGETIRPATTGTGAGTGAPPLKADEAARGTASNGKLDVRSMDQKAYQELLRQRGINPVI